MGFEEVDDRKSAVLPLYLKGTFSQGEVLLCVLTSVTG